MRIWSVHPKYLDAKGLIALWRETLLAKHVLAGKTRGYKNHPQLDRFKACKDPLNAINFYLAVVHREAENRGYHFNRKKIDWKFRRTKIKVTDGQMTYELRHLKKKLKVRDKEKLKEIAGIKDFSAHPIFKVVEGKIEPWEVIAP